MADRILTWAFENVDRDGSEQLPTYYMEQDYTPSALRVIARRSPDADALSFDIKDDGITILSRRAKLGKGETQEFDAEEFPLNPSTIAEGSLVTLDVTPNGAKGISIYLELTAD